MKNSTRVLIVLAAVLSVLLVAAPACAANNAVTFGISGPYLESLEYERGLSESTSWYIVYGVSLFDLTGINLGMKWYDRDSLMDGRYYGLYAGYAQSDFFHSRDRFFFLGGVLGYKKAYHSGFCFDAGLELVAFMYEKSIDGGLGVTLMAGYGW